MMTRTTPGALRRATHVVSVCLALSAVARAQTPDTAPRHFLWTVKDGANTLYLAGSLHALSKDVYPLDEVYDRAFDASDTLVEEVDLAELEASGTNAALLARGLLAQGQTLQSTVSPDTWAGLARHVARLGMSAEVLQPFEPWMAVMTISTFGLRQAGLDPALGLDRHFFDRAVAAGKAVVGLETAESQISRLDELPPEAQEQLLRATLTELETSRPQLEELVAAWRRGNREVIERMTLGDLTSHPAVYRSLIVERNQNWMPRLDECLATSTCFVVVGAGHLVGRDGLLALLAQKGYVVEQQ